MRDWAVLNYSQMRKMTLMCPGALFFAHPPSHYRRSHEADEERRSGKVCSPRSTLTKQPFSTSCFSRVDFNSGGLS
ncbi:hypothetical protein TNCT_210401 [Trichonephila clavata]|uniref:Uncharacterized protein n=1 Tax=Trichonephila clavata TaxID=2740835 RepID=A0A8X6JD26_TRICU|nr:hypothetical protein TNCT_210401 [Trichonephila clavata]